MDCKAGIRGMELGVVEVTVILGTKRCPMLNSRWRVFALANLSMDCFLDRREVGWRPGSVVSIVGIGV